MTTPKILLPLLLSFLVSASAWAGVDFDGTDDYIDLGNPSELQLLSNMTVSAWVYPDTVTLGTAGGMQIVAKDSNTGGRAYTFDFAAESSTEKIRFYINGGSAFPTTTNIARSVDNPLTISTWHHVVGVYQDDGATGTLRVYVDGAQSGSDVSGSGAIPSATSNVNVGRRTYASFENYWNGRISEVAIWSAVLTPADVSQLYHAKVKRMPLQIRPASLVGYWPMDDVPEGTSSDGDSFLDLSSSNNAGTGVDGANNAGLTAIAEVLTYP